MIVRDVFSNIQLIKPTKTKFHRNSANLSVFDNLLFSTKHSVRKQKHRNKICSAIFYFFS